MTAAGCRTRPLSLLAIAAVPLGQMLSTQLVIGYRVLRAEIARKLGEAEQAALLRPGERQPRMV
jgi:hypothetical protein